MSILVLSADADAARSLCSALLRSGQAARWEAELDSALIWARQQPPHVIVADTAVSGHGTLIDEVRASAPWTRIYLIADPSVAFPSATAPVVPKPFDAAELAALLAREQELAELERGRQSLEAHAEELALLVSASFEAIIGLTRDGTVRSWNPGASSIYGYSADEIVGSSIGVLEIDPEETRSRLRAGTRQTLEVTRRRKDGSEILVLLSLSPIARGTGGLGFAEVSLDVTQRRKLERELEHSERLAAIGRLSASMAHEINNPLAVIRACASYVAEVAEQLQESELALSAADVQLAAERIGGFVQHVCGFARREQPELADTPVRATIEIALRMVRPRALDKGVDVRLMPGPDPRVPHDPPRLSQALLNVLANAVDAAENGGHNVWLGVVVEPGSVRIQVDDDGPGIAKEIESSLFEPFTTTKPYGQGTGLGLAITRQILLDHGGSVALEPREEGGARAELCVPSLEPSNHRVLVIDADPAVRRAMVAELRREGFQVLAAGSFAEARETLLGTPVRVVVTDVQLPDGAGAELVGAIRAASPRSRCLIASSESHATRIEGADMTIGKPWDRGKLIAAVRGLCVGR